MTTEETLSNSKQLLLSRFFDGECGPITSWRARRLIRQNLLAKQFFDNLEAIQIAITDHQAHRLESVDLWGRIEQRIEEETKAEFYLGARKAFTKPTIFENLLDTYGTWIGGVSGAAIAGLALLTLQNPSSTPTSITAPSNLTRATTAQPIAARTNGFQQSMRAPRLQRNNIESFEVDWMRSEGALHFIPDPNGSSTIIWITRDSDRYPHSKQHDDSDSHSRIPLNQSVTTTPLGEAVVAQASPRTLASLPTVRVK